MHAPESAAFDGVKPIVPSTSGAEIQWWRVFTAVDIWNLL
jgi:hypothetical protein